MAAPYPQFYDSTDTTLQSAASSFNVNAGSTQGPTTFHVWNDKGASQGSTKLTGARLVVEAFDGTNWVRSGLPALDEGWAQVQLTGQNTTADPTMVAQTTAFVPLGTNRALILYDISQNCARFVNFQVVVPAGAATGNDDVRLVLVYNESSTPLGLDTSLPFGSAIIPDRFSSVTRLLSGGGITAAGTDTVTVLARRWTGSGFTLARQQETVQLNQTSGSGALIAGQSYIGCISQDTFTVNGIAGDAPTLTKGNAGVSPTKPAVPVGNVLLGYVTVAFQAGGTSIINTGNVDMTSVIYGEYTVTAGTGLNATIGVGTSITSSDSSTFSTSPSTVALSNNATSVIWLYPDGTFNPVVGLYVSQSPPVVGAQALAEVVTSGGAITTITDYKQFVARAIIEHVMVLKYRGPVPAGGVLAVDWDMVPFDAVLDRYKVMAGSASLNTNVKIDVRWASSGGLGGTTIFSTSPVDTRPVIVGNNISPLWLNVTGNAHVKTEFLGRTQNEVAILDIVGAAVDGGAIDITVHLYFRRKSTPNGS